MAIAKAEIEVKSKGCLESHRSWWLVSPGLRLFDFVFALSEIDD
jgi:hypothetical protein